MNAIGSMIHVISNYVQRITTIKIIITMINNVSATKTDSI